MTRNRDRKKEQIETDSFDREQTELDEFYAFQSEVESVKQGMARLAKVEGER